MNTISVEDFETIMASESFREQIYNVNYNEKRVLLPYAAKKPLEIEASFTASLFIKDRPTGFEKFYVIKRANRSLLSRETAIRYHVLMLGLNVPVPESLSHEEKEISDYVSLQINIIESLEERRPFPKFNMPPVKLNIDESIQGHPNTYTNISPAWQPAVKKRLQEMVDNDIIEELNPTMRFDHCSSLLAVPKGINDFRIVVDLRKPNKCIIREPHLMPTFEMVVAALTGCKWFSTIDLTSAFFHVELDEQSRHVTNFFSGDRYYRYVRMPFGLCNAPDIFQDAMERIFRDCEGVMIYLDDILVYGKTRDEHDKHLQEVLRRLKEHNVSLNQKKCSFSKTSCTFLGFKIDKDGYHVTDERLEAIKNFRRPENIAEVRSFLGLMNFVDKFIMNRVDKTMNLQNLIVEKTFRWTALHEKEFKYMTKSALKSIKSLGFFDPSMPIELMVDASPVGLGAILYHDGENNRPSIIACANKSLTATERRYSQTQRETLAVVWAVKRFRFYLTGRKFTVWTDGEANEFLYNEGHRLGKRAVSRAEAWTLRLSSYDFSIKRVAGDRNIADALSRLIKDSQKDDPFDDTDADHIMLLTDEIEGPLTYEEIAEHTEADETLNRVKESLTTGVWYPETKNFEAIKKGLYIVGDVIVHKDKYVVPTSLQEKALRLAHRGHFGMSSMKRNLRRSLWWPKLSKQVEDSVKKCVTCERISQQVKPVPLSSRSLPEEPMEVIQADFLYIPKYGSQEFLMVTDVYSRMFWIIEMRHTDGSSTLAALKTIFNVWGHPRVMMTDNGPPFNSPVFSKMCANIAVEHKKVVPFCPQMNGMIERRNQGVLKAMRAAEIDATPWREALHEYVNAYNHEVPHSTTGATPFELMTQRKFRGFFPSMWGMESTVPDRDEIEERDATAKLKSATYADMRRGAKPSEIGVGDWVMISNKHRDNKLACTYLEAKFQVIARKGAKVIVRSCNGTEYTRWVSDVKIYPNAWIEM